MKNGIQLRLPNILAAVSSGEMEEKRDYFFAQGIIAWLFDKDLKRKSNATHPTTREEILSLQYFVLDEKNKVFKFIFSESDLQDEKSKIYQLARKILTTYRNGLKPNEDAATVLSAFGEIFEKQGDTEFSNCFKEKLAVRFYEKSKRL